MEEHQKHEGLLNNVCRQTGAGPVQTIVEVAVTSGVIRALEHLEVADRVDHDEGD